MKKILPFLLVFLFPCLLAAQALHQWKGEAQIEGNFFKLKLIILENQQFIALVQTQEAPFAVEGTWKSKDEKNFSLTVTTEKVLKEEIPIRKGTLYIVGKNTAVVVAEGFGVELKRGPSPSETPSPLKE